MFFSIGCTQTDAINTDNLLADFTPLVCGGNIVEMNEDQKTFTIESHNFSTSVEEKAEENSCVTFILDERRFNSIFTSWFFDTATVGDSVKIFYGLQDFNEPVVAIDIVLEGYEHMNEELGEEYNRQLQHLLETLAPRD